MNHILGDDVIIVPESELVKYPEYENEESNNEAESEEEDTHKYKNRVDHIENSGEFKTKKEKYNEFKVYIAYLEEQLTNMVLKEIKRKRKASYYEKNKEKLKEKALKTYEEKKKGTYAPTKGRGRPKKE